MNAKYFKGKNDKEIYKVEDGKLCKYDKALYVGDDSLAIVDSEVNACKVRIEQLTLELNTFTKQKNAEIEEYNNKINLMETVRKELISSKNYSNNQLFWDNILIK